MFTGLIEAVGVIDEAQRGRGLRIAVRAGPMLEETRSGDSIAVDGVCLTVERVEGDRFAASLLPETSEGTTLGSLSVGDRVNLERALRLGGRLGGHLVSGHVDGTAEVTRVTPRGATRLLELLAPAGLEQYLVDRGSVCLNGASLTVRQPQGRRFAVSLVGVTLAATNLAQVSPGSLLNFEADLVAKHIARLLPGRGGEQLQDRYQAWLSETE